MSKSAKRRSKWASPLRPGRKRTCTGGVSYRKKETTEKGKKETTSSPLDSLTVYDYTVKKEERHTKQIPSDEIKN